MKITDLEKGDTFTKQINDENFEERKIIKKYEDENGNIRIISEKV